LGEAWPTVNLILDSRSLACDAVKSHFLEGIRSPFFPTDKGNSSEIIGVGVIKESRLYPKAKPGYGDPFSGTGFRL
jgi:hypothetical protein